MKDISKDIIHILIERDEQIKLKKELKATFCAIDKEFSSQCYSGDTVKALLPKSWELFTLL